MKKVFFLLICWTKIIAIDNQSIDWIEKEIEADGALRMGIPHLAESYYDEILQSPLNPLLEQRFLLKKITAQIAQNKIKQAGTLILSLPEPQDPVAILLSKIIQFLKNPTLASEYFIDLESDKSLPHKWRSWACLYHYFVLIQQGKYELAQSRESDLSKYTGSIATNWIEPIFKQNQWLYSSADSEQGETLKKLIEEFSGTDLENEYVRNFAIYQFRIGNPEKARKILYDFLLSKENIPQEIKDRFYYTITVMAEPDHKDRFDSWSFIIRDGKTEKPLLYCLAQIRASQLDDNQINTLLLDINDRLNRNTKVIQRSEWIRTKASLHWKKKDWDALAKDAQELLEYSDNDRLYREANYWQAYQSLSRSPKQYGNATIAFANLLKKLPEGDEKQQVRLQLADSLLQNSNFQEAAKVYQVSQDFSTKELLPFLVYHQIFCEIKSRNLDWVEVNLHPLSSSVSLKNSSTWGLELLFWKALEKDPIERIKNRIDKVWESFNYISGSIDNNLKTKIYLYYANILKNKETHTESLALIDELLNQLRKKPSFNLQEFPIGSEILLFKGELELIISPMESSLTTLKTLRKLFPKSDHAILSYILESRFWSDLGRSVDAQNILNKLVENFPDSNFAPIALFEAALQSSHRGSLDKREEDAIQLLEKIVQDYPSHPLHSYALLQQAELLWRNGDLAFAKETYQKVLDAYPYHSERTAIRLSIAKILMAQKSTSNNYANQAMVIFESISRENNLPLALEIEIKINWALALRNIGKLKEAEKLYWQDINQYLVAEEKTSPLPADILWWLGEMILSLGELYKEMGKDDDAMLVYQWLERYSLPQKLIVKTMLSPIKDE